jgi:hypothetical protein
MKKKQMTNIVAMINISCVVDGPFFIKEDVFIEEFIAVFAAFTTVFVALVAAFPIVFNTLFFRVVPVMLLKNDPPGAGDRKVFIYLLLDSYSFSFSFSFSKMTGRHLRI